MLVSVEKGVTNDGTIVHCNKRAKSNEEERSGKHGTIVHCEEGNIEGRQRQ
jgi:hypothetical protein